MSKPTVIVQGRELEYEYMRFGGGETYYVPPSWGQIVERVKGGYDGVPDDFWKGTPYTAPLWIELMLFEGYCRRFDNVEFTIEVDEHGHRTVEITNFRGVTDSM